MTRKFKPLGLLVPFKPLVPPGVPRCESLCSLDLSSNYFDNNDFFSKETMDIKVFTLYKIKVHDAMILETILAKHCLNLK